MVIVKLMLVIAVLMVLIFKKVNMALSLLAASVLLLLLNGRGPAELWAAVRLTATEPTSYTMVLSILFIGVLGYLMNRYQLLGRMVSHLERLVRSAKATIMLAPSIMGLLLVTGGALLSCPVVDSLGERLGLPGDRRAAINLIFRHGLYFIYPLSPTLILASQLGGFRVGELVRIQFILSVFIYLLGYFLLLRGVPDVKAPKLSRPEFIENLLGFLVASLPITSTVIATLAGLPFHWSLPVGIAAAIVINLAERRACPQYRLEESPLRLLLKGVNLPMVLIIIAVLLFKNCIAGVTEINDYIVRTVAAGVPLELVILATCVAITFPTGNFNPSLAVVFPFIMAVATSPSQVLLYAYILYCLGFLTYYASPVHMCQVLTLEYFKTPLSGLMRQYRVFIPVLAVFMAAWYGVLRLAL